MTKEQEELLKQLMDKRTYHIERVAYHAKACYDLEKAMTQIRSSKGLEFADFYIAVKCY